MKSPAAKQITFFLILVVGLIFLNIITSSTYIRWDLTEDKKYTISESTSQLLEDVDDVVYIKIYLEGEFKAKYKRLQNAIRQTLVEFNSYNDNIQFDFIDPHDFETDKERQDNYALLAKKGLIPSTYDVMEGDATVNKVMFPGAILSYNNKEVAVQLYKGSPNSPEDVRLDESIENIEFEIISAIRKIRTTTKKKMAILAGHGELNAFEIQKFAQLASPYFNVTQADLHKVVDLHDYDLVVCAKPTERFSDTSLFKLDQYLVKGGSMIFTVDAMNVPPLDTIGRQGAFALPYEQNLRDLFFKLGVRINNDLVKDINSASIMMDVGNEGDQKRNEMRPWRYYPLVGKFSDHPITENLGALMIRYGSTIDTVKADGIKKTPLFMTSENSRIVSSPIRMNFNDARIKADPNTYVNSNLALGYLLEGKFQSMFKGRLPAKTRDAFDFKEQTDSAGKVIILSDGDLIRNVYKFRGEEPIFAPIGFDPNFPMILDNEDFFRNAMDYLTEDDGLIIARNKQIILRPLDKVKIEESKTYYQISNIVYPVVIVLLFAIVWYFVRLKQYTRFT